jgi:hypothetical protein
MIVLLAAGVIVAVIVVFAQGLGMFIAFWMTLFAARPRRRTLQEPPSGVRILGSSQVVQEDLEGWDGAEELEVDEDL